MKFALLSHLTGGAPAEHIMAAMDADDGVVTAFQLLTQADVESRLQPDVVSGVMNGRRVTGRRYRKFPSNFVGPYFCGSTQLHARTERECKVIARDIRRQYRGAVAHIHDWLDYCKRKGRPGMRCALTGYGGGGKATTMKGRAYHYAVKIIDRSKRKWRK